LDRSRIVAAMSDADTFAQLCERLRKIGVVKIDGNGFSAVFDLSHRTQPAPTTVELPTAAAAKAGRKKAVPEEKLREEFYARELGKV
jgi:hypothetical protein